MDCNCQSFLAVTTRCACRLLSSGGVSGNSAVSAFDIESIQEQYIDINEKKRAPEIVAPSSSRSGVSPLRRNLVRGERERADQVASSPQ